MIGLSPLSAGHRRRFQPTCVRPSTGSYPRFSLPTDSSPGFASAARDSSRPVKARFRSGSLSVNLAPRLASKLNLAASRNSLAHSTKGTPSRPRKGTLRLLVGTRFQVLFHSPPGVLFTFPSRYWCAIGHRVVLRLGWWSTQVRTGFHVPGPTQGPRRAVRSGFAYGAVTRCGRPSHAVPLPSRTCARGRQPPDARPCNPVGGTPAGYARSTVWPSVPFRSPLLGESRD